MYGLALAYRRIDNDTGRACECKQWDRVMLIALKHLFLMLIRCISRIRACRCQADASFIVCYDAASRQSREFQEDTIT